MKQIDMTKWPAPVIRLYLGQLTSEAVLAAAVDPNSETQKGQVCETNFYTGELALQRGDKDGATHLFRFAAAGCPKSFIEYDGGVAEIKALGLQPRIASHANLSMSLFPSGSPDRGANARSTLV